MSKKIKVLLLEDIASLGTAGQIVTVAEGYARNSLFPQGKAALADEQIQTSVDQKAKQTQQATDQELANLQQQADELDGTELTFTAKTKEGDDIYGSITPGQIAKELTKAANLKVKAKDIKLDRKITKVGAYQATVSLSPDVETTIQISVAAEVTKQSDDGESS